jgi:arylsulfatase
MSDKPNILILMTDQQRFDSLGCYGCEKVNTPALDRLAAEGALFENCYVNSTICTPSRASLLTGRPVPGHGVHKLHDVLPPELVLFPQRLQENGYKTALIGKLHVSGHAEESKRRHPNDGFDLYEWCPDPAIQLDSDYNSYSKWLQQHHPEFYARLVREKKKLKHFPAQAHLSYWAAEQTMQFLESHDKEQPFFCFMSLYDPHDPFLDYPLEALEYVNKDKLELPRNDTMRPDDVPEGVKQEQERFKANGYTDDELIAVQEGYYASIGFLDAQFGRVLDKLKQLGMENNTLVVFVSDHGEMMGDKDLITKGAYYYDACAKVPLVMRLPGVVPAGARREQLVQLHDLAATCLSLSGISRDNLDQSMPHAMDLLPLAQDADAAGRDHAVTYYRNCRYWNPEIYSTMFREERYKLNVYHDICLTGGAQQGELFDMEEHQMTKFRLLFRLMDWTMHQEHMYRAGRGGPDLTVERR